jgi:hypothetical protein
MVINHHQIAERLDSQVQSITNLDNIFDLVVSKAEELIGYQMAYQYPTEFNFSDEETGFSYNIIANESFDNNGTVVVNVRSKVNEVETHTISMLIITMNGEFNEQYFNIPRTVRSRIFSFFSEIEDAVDQFINGDEDEESGENA